MNQPMETNIDAIILNGTDNIAVCLRDIAQGSVIRIKTDAEICDIMAIDSIEYGHKIAITNIQKGLHIIKYSEVIGTAVVDIQKGAHVHIHNITD